MYSIKDGRTPLLAAAHQGHLNVVKYLFTEAKVNPNQPDKVLSGSDDVCDRDVCVCVCVCAYGEWSAHVHLHSLLGDHAFGECACGYACVHMCE